MQQQFTHEHHSPTATRCIHHCRSYSSRSHLQQLYPQKELTEGRQFSMTTIQAALFNSPNNNHYRKQSVHEAVPANLYPSIRYLPQMAYQKELLLHPNHKCNSFVIIFLSLCLILPIDRTNVWVCNLPSRSSEIIS